MDRQVCRLGALEDARGIDANLAIRIRQACPVAHQPADFGKRAIQINRRDREARCEVDQLDAPRHEEGVGVDEKRVGPLARKRREGRIDLVAGVGVEHLDLEPHGARSRCRIPHRGLVSRSIGGADEHGNASGCRHHLTQELQPLCRQLRREHIDPCDVAAGLGEAGD
jgi:hypothetical protein